MCVGSAPKLPDAPEAPPTVTTAEPTAEDASPLVIGSKRKPEDARFDADKFGKNALKIALSIPTTSGLQAP